MHTERDKDQRTEEKVVEKDGVKIFVAQVREARIFLNKLLQRSKNAYLRGMTRFLPYSV